MGVFFMLHDCPQTVSYMDNTKNVVDVFVIDRQSRVTVLERFSYECLDCSFGRDTDHVDTRCHHFTCRCIGKVEDTVQHFFLFRFKNTFFVACRYKHLQFFFRVNSMGGWRLFDFQDADDDSCCSVQYFQKGPGDYAPKVHRQHSGQNNRFSTAVRKHLGQ
ncbi:MAG: hypothetical protein BWY75_01558 [bacterium ADurb.Bin425]|nr:MAG: hypothetical protein BWY75_01558 [bacterium ADurb.Bin425]